ncbi:aminotransferase class V-fold PLP-dependent enzyme [Lewinella sp. W8]|uniref:aminotransferase class V-fold PLP-dependent enzyme n=1 Tax=Lewinella sp. W8 TaxID=2528208 RepID=UPI0010682AE2|nr:aminotransferase class V-fold PLP-dependent enzyme [Lewinella sp. W8]MTB50791.1 aminotransferase class V-fold PLP-dependent enzyme [Lewinella sp. W8]
MTSRRSWLRNSVLGLAGSTLLTPQRLSALRGHQHRLDGELSGDPDSEKYWALVREHFSFAENLRYFNNGSLGACPTYVVEATNAFRATLDGFPSKYMWGGWQDQKEAVRGKVAAMLHVSPETIALIHNTTEGMNLIASSMDLAAGDEVLLSNHEHTSARIPWKYWQEGKGVVLKTVNLPLIPEGPQEIVEAFRQAITPRTRVISLVHLTNTNGMILPVKAISEMAHAHGILVAVDGAQSMGMINIDLEDLGCDFFTSSSHKWTFSPKGMGVFYAREAAQKHLRPLIVCRGYEDESIRRLENYNTRNLPELLGLGAAMDYRNLIGGEEIERRIYALKAYLREAIAQDERLVLKTPGSDLLSAGIQTVELREHQVGEVKQKLADEFHIDCRPMGSHGLNGLRISLAIYHTKADVDYLVEALRQVLDA